MITTQVLCIEGHKLVANVWNAENPGQPIVLLHGITANIDAWQAEQLRVVLPYGPCYALSLPGHYPATFPPGFRAADITAGMMMRVLAAAIHELVGDQPVTLIGHSTGGFSTLGIAACAPDLVSRAISVSGFIKGQWHGILAVGQWFARRGPMGKAIFRAVYALDRVNPAIQAASWRFYAANVSRFFSNPNFKEYQRMVYPNFKRLDLRAMAEYFCAMPDIDITDWLPGIKARLLLLTGDTDPVVSPSESEQAAALVPGAELAIIKECGHIPYLEQPAAYDRLIDEFMKRTTDVAHGRAYTRSTNRQD